MTKEEAKEYIDNYISHIILMTEYGNWFANEIKILTDEAILQCDKVLKEHKNATTKSICNQCKSEIDSILKTLENDITSLIEQEVMKLSEEEQDWLSECVEAPLGLHFNYPDKATKLLLLIPIASAGIVGAYGKTLSDRLRNIYEQEVMTSYVSGLPFEDIDDEVKFNTFNRGLESDCETIGESLSGQYDRIIYTANDKKIKGYVWQSLLDGRTCILCASLSGTVYKNIHDAPVFPAHQKCRCSLIAVTDDIEKLIPETYEQWFESQTMSNKRKILGKTRFELYENGMKIKQFVNNGKITPLKDLKDKK